MMHHILTTESIFPVNNPRRVYRSTPEGHGFGGVPSRICVLLLSHNSMALGQYHSRSYDAVDLAIAAPEVRPLTTVLLNL